MAEEKSDKPEFEMIRRTPPPESSSSTPLVIALVAILAVVGGYLATRPATETPDDTTSETEEIPAEDAPDYIMEDVNNMAVIRVYDAYEKALGYREEYPNAPNLEERILELREELIEAGYELDDEDDEDDDGTDDDTEDDTEDDTDDTEDDVTEDDTEE